MLKGLFLAALLGACASPLSASPTPDRQACSPLPGWRDIAEATAGKFLIFGETHGTRESPHAVTAFICHLPDDPVLVAVELDSTMDAQLQQAWTGSNQTASGLREALMSIFSQRLDGVGSEAVIDMLTALLELRQAGRKIDVVAFNGARDQEQSKRFAHLPGQEPHESAQAENIRTAAARQAYRHVVVLVGSLHAQKTAVTIGDTRFEPMAMKLAPPDQVVSLRMTHAGGTAWNCRLKGTAPPVGRNITQADLDCSSHTVTGSATGEPGVILKKTNDAAFDGEYFVGVISASSPPS